MQEKLYRKIEGNIAQLKNYIDILRLVSFRIGAYMLLVYYPLSKIPCTKKQAFVWKHRLILDFLKRTFSGELSSAKDLLVYPNYAGDANEYDGSIWVWWNDATKVPPIVSRCIFQMRKYAVGKVVRLVTEQNYSQYFSIPDYIEDKYRKGLITQTHFSDIVRMTLMSKYGGIYMDATLLQTGVIPQNYLDLDFYTNKVVIDKPWEVVSEGKLSSFFFACRKGNLMIETTRRMMLQYWKLYDLLIDYLWIDYLWILCAECLPQIKEMIEQVPYSNPSLYTLKNSNLPCSEAQYFVMLGDKNTVLYKFSYKDISRYSEKTADGELTLKGRVIHTEV